MAQKGEKQVAVFGGGCFWCTEAVFGRLRGVASVVPGYAGGDTENPTYGEVSRGDTGHAEVVRVEYDPEKISYKNLLDVFFAVHDATQVNRQGSDTGTQYRSVIFFTTEEQRKEAESALREVPGAVTQILPLQAFTKAEEEHWDFYEKNRGAPYCQVVIDPKLQKLQEKFPELLGE